MFVKENPDRKKKKKKKTKHAEWTKLNIYLPKFCVVVNSSEGFLKTSQLAPKVSNYSTTEGAPYSCSTNKQPWPATLLNLLYYITQ